MTDIIMQGIIGSFLFVIIIAMILTVVGIIGMREDENIYK